MENNSYFLHISPFCWRWKCKWSYYYDCSILHATKGFAPKRRHPQGSFVLVSIRSSFCKVVTLEWYFIWKKNMFFTWWDNIAWPIRWISMFKFCQICPWWLSWKICSSQDIFISPTPLSNIWTSLNLSRSWKHRGKLWRLSKGTCWSLWSVWW